MMPSNIENLSRLKAYLVIDELVNQGVTHFFASPGMRNAPFLWAIKKHKLATVFMGIDERSHAYQALGFAKRSQRPAALLCTSGSALSHYYPAVLEAHKGNIPLVIISSDRPPELNYSGANQTINQQGFFSQFVNYFQDLGTPTEDISPYAIRSLTAHAISKFQGPVHLNVPFRGPLDQTKENISPQYLKMAEQSFLKKIVYHPFKNVMNQDSIDHLIQKISQAKTGLLVFGQLEDSDHSGILNFIEKMGWPCFFDPTSNLKFNHKLSKTTIPSFEHPEVYDYFSNNAPELVIHFGGPVVSKHYYRFLEENTLIYLICVHPRSTNENPSFAMSEKITLDENAFCEALLPSISPTEYSDERVNLFNSMASLKRKVIIDSPFSYPLLTLSLLENINNQTTLYLGNSTVIRSFDNYCSLDNTKDLKIIHHRGVSGIEGFLSGALGAQKASKEPLVLVLGDISFLHDLGALIHFKEIDSPLIVVIANNNGGGIFSLLPISNDKEVLPYLFTEQDEPFDKILEAHQISYSICETEEQFRFNFLENQKIPKAHFILCNIDNELNTKLYSTLKTIKL